MNLSSLRQEVYDMLDDEFGVSSLRFPQQMIDQFINDGVREMVVRSCCDVDTFTLVPSVGRNEYDLPDSCVKVLRVYRSQAAREKVWPITLEELDQEIPGWQDTTGNRFQWYFQMGLTRLFIGPAFGSPTDALYEVTFSSDPGPVPLTTDDAEPPMPEAYQSGVIDYAVSRALLIGARGEQLASAAALMGNFQQEWSKLREETFATLDRVHIMRGQDPGRRDFGVVPLFRRDRGTLRG